MTCERLFRDDAYLKSCTARVVAVSARGAGRVRLLKIPGIDLQPCGGTHVRHLAEIGRVKVLRLRREGKRNQRVEIGFA